MLFSKDRVSSPKAISIAVRMTMRYRSVYKVLHEYIKTYDMSDLFPTIGLEIHAELQTKSKMFCGCSNNPDESSPNALICPVCMAYPGTLPVINKEAVRHVLRVGCAVGGTIADFTEFDRKNYFYPDIPKGYQISQYKYPLISGGSIGGVAITRIHLEEDTARSSHASNASLVDFNRAGVPLMELVTEPVIHDAETAVSFARDLRLLLIYLGASHANMEKGEMRVEANISLAPRGKTLGTKVEVKNLNSFKAVEQAIAYEIKRQTGLIEAGKEVVQETRGWDENTQKTFSQRSKENAHDYRYFPDPDLPKIWLSELEGFRASDIQHTLPALPWEVRALYRERGLQEHVVEVLVSNLALRTFYEGVIAGLSTPEEQKLAINYITSDMLGLLALESYRHVAIGTLSVREFIVLIQLAYKAVLSSRGTKDVLAKWLQEGGDPASIAKDLGVLQNSNTDELATIVDTVVRTHEQVVAEYLGGKEQALQFLVGQCMKVSKGSGNPGLLRDMLQKKMGEKKK